MYKRDVLTANYFDGMSGNTCLVLLKDLHF